MKKLLLLFFLAATLYGIRTPAQTTVNGDLTFVGGAWQGTQVANDTSFGTTLNSLAKLVGGTGLAITSAVNDTSGMVGVVTVNAGTSGSATIAQFGQVQCNFDSGGSVAGDYVINSTLVAGDCADGGVSFPTSQVVGRVLTTNVGAGLYTIILSNFSNLSLAAPFAIKPGAGDAIQFVSATGKDTNDGFSWGTAKLTIMAAYDALPSAGGTIQFTQNVAATSTSGQGIWICGPADTVCQGALPAGWRLAKTGTVYFQGIGGGPLISAGSLADNNHPAIWLSGNGQTMVFENFSYQYPNVGIRIGCTAAGDCTSSNGGVSGVIFRDVVGHINQVAGSGPDVYIGSNSFWIYFNYDGFSGNSAEQVAISTISRSSNVLTVTTNSPFTVTPNQHLGIQQATDPSFNSSYSVISVTNSTHFTVANNGPDVGTAAFGGTVVTDKQIPIVIDPGTGSGSGLVYINGNRGGNFFSMGAVRLWPGTNGGGVYVNNISVEGDNSHIVAPPVWVGSQISPTNTNVNGVELSDAIGLTPTVEIDNSSANALGSTELTGIAGTVMGPATWLNGVLDNSNSTVSPLRAKQQGFFSGRMEGSSDVGRGIFSPTGIQAANIANTSPAAWSTSGTLTTSISGPDGTTGAGRFSVSGTGVMPVTGGPAIASGVIYVWGVWVRSQTGNGYANNILARFDTNASGFGGGNRCNNTGLASQSVAQIMKSDGQWEYASGVCKITTADATVGLELDVFADGTHTVDAYDPIVLAFAPGAISDNESYEIQNNLSDIPTNCVVAAVCMMPGQQMGVSGSTQFMGFLTQANTANRTYTFPDLSGTVGFLTTLVTKTTTYPAVAGDYTILCNGTFTTTLPVTGILVGKIYNVKNIGTGVCTVAAASGNIDGSATYVISSQYQAAAFVWDGSQWWVL